MAATPSNPSDPSDQPTAFLVTAAGAAPLSRKQTRGRSFVAPSRGVRYRADARDERAAAAEAALLVTRPGSVLCDVSAAEHWRLPLPPWLRGGDPCAAVSVAVAPNGAHPDRRGLRGRRLDIPAEHLRDLGAVRVTTPARTWLDCAELIPLEHVVAMGDAVLRRGLADEASLARMVAWGRGRRGVVSARRALGWLDPRAQSPQESVVRCQLLLGGIRRPLCNLDITVDGEWLARADLAWPEERVIVEYDGAVHLPEQQRRADAARRNLLQDRGWLVIVLTARDLRHPHQMVELVRSALRARTPWRAAGGGPLEGR
jgi:hypothetical protein